MRIDLSRIHWPQVAVLVSLIAGVVLVLIFAPPEVVAKLPWPVLAGGAGTAGAGILASFLGSLVKPASESVPPSAPTTPAAEAKRQHVATLRGEDPAAVTVDDDTDQEAPTKPGGGT